MKKLSLLVAGMMMFGFTYAGEGKACCKKDEKCKKEETAKCGDKKGGDAKACCKSKSEKASLSSSNHKTENQKEIQAAPTK